MYFVILKLKLFIKISFNNFGFYGFTQPAADNIALFKNLHVIFLGGESEQCTYACSTRTDDGDAFLFRRNIVVGWCSIFRECQCRLLQLRQIDRSAMFLAWTHVEASSRAYTADNAGESHSISVNVKSRLS